MRIFAISVVKNEADIIAKNLREAARWADKIFVLDNGSTDGTWEIVQSLASEKIIPWKRDSTPFHNGIRAQVYHAFKHLASQEDWWCFRLDADEFYADDPREFLAKVPRYHHFVVTDTIHFRLTHEDVADANSSKDIDSMRYHEKHTWSEARFFRHRPGLEWTSAMVRPKHMGVMHPARIKVKHYQFRSFSQIKTRVAVRAEARRHGHPGFVYSVDTNLNSYIFDKNELTYYAGDNNWSLTGPLVPLHQRWYEVVLETIFHTLGIYP